MPPRIERKKTPAPAISLGIDPGSNGGVAVISAERKLLVASPFPKTERDLLDFLRELKRKYEVGVAAIERQVPRPTAYRDRRSGVMINTILKSTCLLFGNYQLLRGLLLSLGIPFQEIEPQKWQRGLGIKAKGKKEGPTAWKNRLKGKAQQLFPQAKVTHAVADAILVAEYARRSL